MTGPVPGKFPVPAWLVGISAAFLAFLVSMYVVLIITNHDTTGVTVLLTTTLPTTGVGLLAVFQTIKNRAAVQQVAEKVETVVQQTNGPLTRMAANVRDIHGQSFPAVVDSEGGKHDA